MNAFDTVNAAVAEGKRMQQAVDDNASSMARLLMFRLRAAGVPHHVLKALKDELRDFNVHTGRWRKK